MNNEFIYSLAPDTLRSIALETPYQDLLKLLRAFPICLKHLHMAFWKLKGLRDLTVSTSSREEYIEQATYAGDVLEGSEKYLFLDYCAMRAGQKKDRQLINYFEKKGANQSFTYYGLICNIKKDDIQDLIDSREAVTEKKGYFYRKCQVLGEKNLPDMLLGYLFGTGLFKREPVEDEGVWVAASERGQINIACDKISCYDLAEICKTDEQGATLWRIPGDKFNKAIDILREKDIPRKEIVEFGRYMCEPSSGFFDNLIMGICIGSSKYPERIKAIEEGVDVYFGDTRHGLRWTDDIKHIFLSELERGYQWGLFLNMKGDMPNDQPWVALIKYMLRRGYKKPIQHLMTRDSSVGYDRDKFKDLYNTLCRDYMLFSMVME